MDFDFKRRSRICSQSERELAPGECYFSVLLEDGDDVVREDISATHWEGPPENCISWWQSRIPDRDPNRFFWAPDKVIIDYFERFQSIKDKRIEQFVLALLLIQKRIFRLVDTSLDEEGREMMHVSCSRKRTSYDVPVETPDPSEVESIQQELTDLLFSDEPFDDETIEDDVEAVDPTDVDSKDEGANPPDPEPALSEDGSDTENHIENDPDENKSDDTLRETNVQSEAP